MEKNEFFNENKMSFSEFQKKYNDSKENSDDSDETLKLAFSTKNKTEK